MAGDPVTGTGVDASGRLWARTARGAHVEEPPLDEQLPANPVPYRRPELIAPAPRWVGPVFSILAALLVPWTIMLALTLPPHQLSHHWRIAWVGFDVMELLALGLTGWFAYRRSTWVELTATVSATLLFVDAWFDVVTAGGGWQFLSALGSAVFAEVPLAALSLWIARHAAAVNERTALFLLHRSQRQAVRLHERSTSAEPP